MNDENQAALSLDFTDGSSGVFVAALPEPGSVVGGMMVIAWAWGGRKRRMRESVAKSR